MRWILACVVCLLVALIWEQWYGAGRSSPPDPAAGARAPDRTRFRSPAALEAARSSAREELPEEEDEAAPDSGDAGDLFELLRRVALAYAAQDATALEGSLAALLRAPARCEEALLLLEIRP